ncbi:helix-turn-helix transcriptional regulator [Pontibacillus litoralis]|uniref:DNA-binding protein n=1 Tax=Pontibacillus litoralis JSM 072002 TaxID=1385512 RepID=A0A0A5G1P9_9BACI|nr:helix-turn-helix transcriptional regulator [Pontibacillus litoralis]KGX85048.1 DNA-binding protein [Pontibacillus litoralis JSM 072002]
MAKHQGQLNNQLNVLRAQKKWSQEDVATKVGVSRQTIISIEANKYNPSLILSFKLAKLFEVDIQDIFSYSELEEK